MVIDGAGERDRTGSLIERWYGEVWNQGREASIFELMHPEAEIFGVGTVPIHGPEEFLPFWKTARKNYPDLHIDIDRLVLEQEQGMALITMHGTRIVSGNAVQMQGAVYFRFHDGLLVFGRNVLDYLAILGQSDVLDLDIRQALFPIPDPENPQGPEGAD